MASSSPSSLDLDLKIAACAGLQSLHSFVSLFSLQQISSSSSSSSLQQQLQHQQSMAASETITQFKHLGTLLSQLKGHARVRVGRRIAATVSSDSHINPNSHPIKPSGNLNSDPIKPNMHLGNPNSPQINPNLPSWASEGFQFSASQATASASFDESNSGPFDDEGQSIRGSSHIDLNYQNDNIDYNYEGSTNKYFYIIEASKRRDNCPSIITSSYNNKHNDNGFSSVINENKPSFFDLNEQAPSLDSSLESKYNCMHTSSTKQTRSPLFCPPPSQESFSLDAHTQSTVVTPSVSYTPSASSNDELAEFANPNPRSLTLYGCHNQGNLSRQLAQILSTNPNFEAELEKAACLINPTTTHACISTVEGSLPAYGSLPQPQPAKGSMDHNSSSAVKRKCPSFSDDSKLTKCGNSSSKCHCAKRRKVKNKSVKRVPAISDKVAEIPHDDYSWRKYGQKPIKGSPYPRGYYKCSGVKGCPAKKHVERALDDPSMLIVTYEGEHIHLRPALEEPSAT